MSNGIRVTAQLPLLYCIPLTGYNGVRVRGGCEMKLQCNRYCIEV